MKVPMYEECKEILAQKLAESYCDESVELGENWELIAEIFYKKGFEDCVAIDFNGES